ncbi:gallinacin-13-like [Heteronotia binoei]|uniref:gallinacin-13-like n=1 Tax=Heteronotia binoei TaxID=13085 RepID=UPI00292F2F7C|nr:gallinacin-13-like [Heteronotia binoei]
MRIFFLLGIFLLFICQSTPASRNLYDSLECSNNHGHCRRLCFHNERPIGTCTNGRQHCCK